MTLCHTKINHQQYWWLLLLLLAITAMTGISQQRYFLQALAFPRGLPKNCHGLTLSISHGFLLSSDFSPVLQPKWSLQLLPQKRTKNFFQHGLLFFFFPFLKFIFFLINQSITSTDVETPKVRFSCINIKYLMSLQIHKVSCMRLKWALSCFLEQWLRFNSYHAVSKIAQDACYWQLNPSNQLHKQRHLVLFWSAAETSSWVSQMWKRAWKVVMF